MIVKYVSCPTHTDFFLVYACIFSEFDIFLVPTVSIKSIGTFTLIGITYWVQSERNTDYF